MASSYREKVNRYSRSASRRKGVLLGGGVVMCLLIYFYFRQSKVQPGNLHVRYQDIVKSDLRSFESLRTAKTIDRGRKSNIDIKMDDHPVNKVDKQSTLKSRKKFYENDKRKSEIYKYNITNTSADRSRGDKDKENDAQYVQVAKANKNINKNGSGKAELDKYTPVIDIPKNIDKEQEKQFVQKLKLINKLSTNAAFERNSKPFNTTRKITTRLNIASGIKQGTVKNITMSRSNGRTQIVRMSNQNSSEKFDQISNKRRASVALQYEKDCVLFRNKFLNKSDTKICQQNLESDKLLEEILKDKIAWKMSHVKTIQTAAHKDRNLVVVDIGCGTGAFPLVLASTLQNMILAIDPHVENLEILNRALAAFKTEGKVKLIPSTITNVTESKNKSSYDTSKMTLDVLSHWHIQKDQPVVVLVSRNGYELETLQGGKLFLTIYNVCAVIVDFSSNRTLETGPGIVQFLQTYGFLTRKDEFNESSMPSQISPKMESGIVFLSKKNKCASSFL